MAEHRQPGTHAGIQRELRNARKRVETRAYRLERQRQPDEPENLLQWHEVQAALGPYISPRIEDREKIISSATRWPANASAKKPKVPLPKANDTRPRSATS